MTSKNSQKLEGGERRVHPLPRKDLEDFDSPLPPFSAPALLLLSSPFDKWWGWERWGAGSQSVPALGGGGRGPGLETRFPPSLARPVPCRRRSRVWDLPSGCSRSPLSPPHSSLPHFCLCLPLRTGTENFLGVSFRISRRHSSYAF